MNIVVIDDEVSLRRRSGPPWRAWATSSRRPPPARRPGGSSASSGSTWPFSICDWAARGAGPAARTAPAAPGPERGGHHGVRHDRHGRRGDAPRGVRLPAQAVHPGPDPRRARARGDACAGCGTRSPTWKSRSRAEVPEADLASAEPADAAACSRWPSRRPRPRRRCCSAARAAPARACWRGPSTRAARGPAGRSSPSTARACRPSCWRASCSATSRARSPAPCATRRQGGRGRGRDAVPRRDRRAAAGTCSRSCCGSCRRRNTSGSARRRPGTADVRVDRRDQPRPGGGGARPGRFREDLFYRLNVIEVTCRRCASAPRHPARWPSGCCVSSPARSAKAVTGFTPEARAALPPRLAGQPARAAQRRRARVDPGGRAGGRAWATCRSSRRTGRRREVEVGGAVTLDELEAEHIRRVLAASPTLDDAARTLGIDPSTLYRKRKRYGL